jgi:hypothetical protein
VVKVTTIREGHEFEDLDYPDENEGIEKLVDAKGTFILWPSKYITVKRRSSPIVSLWSTVANGTPTSSMPKPAQIEHPFVTPTPAQNREDPELQERTGRRPPSPVKESEGQSLRTTGSKGCLLLLLKTLKAQSHKAHISGVTEPPLK